MRASITPRAAIAIVKQIDGIDASSVDSIFVCANTEQAEPRAIR
jgi:hypothetical protein